MFSYCIESDTNKINLRKKTRVSYYEPEEPAFDEYMYCVKCADYVYEYCSIHGPLLVIPDNKVPPKTNLPSYVPRAALTIPHLFLHLAPSTIQCAGLGVFSSLTLPRGVQFGPYDGKRSRDASSAYCWQLYDRNNKPSYMVDAEDANNSNWMRYVNCSRHWMEQNMAAYQYQGQLYYRTIKVIPKFTELLIFYGSEFANSLNINLRTYNSPVYAHISGMSKELDLGEKYINDDNKETTEEEEEFIEDILTECERETEDIKIGCSSILYQLEEKETHDYDKSEVYTKQPENIRSNNEHTPNDISFNNNSTFNCNHCNKQFQTKRDLIRHKLNNYYCNDCKYHTKVKKMLEAHTKLHDKSRQHVCDLCSYRFATPSNLKRHIKDVHVAAKKYSCHLCSYKTNKSYSLKKHENAHSNKLKIECKLQGDCNSNDKPYKCTICDAKFSKKRNLGAHIRRHNGKKTNPVLDKTSQNQVQVHSKDRFVTPVNCFLKLPYTCNVCQREFTQNYMLKRHMEVHSTDRPYLCIICQTKYVHERSLKRHVRTVCMKK